MFLKIITTWLVLCSLQAFALGTGVDDMEILQLDVIAFEDFASDDPGALKVLHAALHEKGIVGIKGIPGYRDKVASFIEKARTFIALPEDVKERYAPDRSRGDLFLGYESGKERFQRADGQWVVDDSKVSYYAVVPEKPTNKWPTEVNLKEPYQDLGALMAETGTAVMHKIGLIGSGKEIPLEGILTLGRMLYYKKKQEGGDPLWCGAHFDHGLFTALLPAFYFSHGELIPEPPEAGLFIKTTAEGRFKKVIADDPDVLLFQVGEFGQLATNDAIQATEHRVHQALDAMERYTMALFFQPPFATVLHSTSVLTRDERYGGIAGAPCSYSEWHEASFNRYLVTPKQPEKSVFDGVGSH